MNTNTRGTKFTDGLERDLIRQENAEMAANGSQDGLEPLLKWVLAVAMAIGSVFIIVQGNL